MLRLIGLYTVTLSTLFITHSGLIGAESLSLRHLDISQATDGWGCDGSSSGNGGVKFPIEFIFHEYREQFYEKDWADVTGNLR